MNIKTLSHFIMIWGLAVSSLGDSVRRGRNEGTFGIRASNVAGSGNISVSAVSGAVLTDNYLQGSAGIGMNMGIAEIMQIGARASFINFSRIGPANAYLQLTLPDNDRLRFFGFSASGELCLSTAQDTLSFNTDSSKPLYSTSLFPSITVDFDFLSINKGLPLKAYFYFGFAHNIQLLYRYKQLCFKGAVEWKMIKHSLFIEGGSALFKEKQNILNRSGDRSYEQMIGWIKPGGRYRLANGCSITGGVGINLFTNERNNSGIDPARFDLSVRFTAPFLFKETNTEAIRTLVFVEKKKENIVSKEGGTENGKAGKPGLPVEGMNKEFFDYNKEKETLQKDRENIEEKMEEIEKLLEEDE